MQIDVCDQCGKPVQERSSSSTPPIFQDSRCCCSSDAETKHDTPPVLAEGSARPAAAIAGRMRVQNSTMNEPDGLSAWVSPQPFGWPDDAITGSDLGFEAEAQPVAPPETNKSKIENGLINDERVFSLKNGDDELIGKTIDGQFQILAKIGTGGMSVVYQAMHLGHEQIVAIKVLCPERQLDDQVIQRLKREAQAACALDQENIVRVRQFGVDGGGYAYLVMDFVDGESLAHRISQRKTLPAAAVIQIANDIARGLSYAHKHGVVHRDIKSGNIMICQGADGNELAKIVDFGLAKSLLDKSESQDLTKSGEVFGSPFYMSPEQCRGRKVDARSDIYSLGCVMYEAITGSPPFKGESCLDTLIKHLNEKPAPIGRIKGGQHLEAIVMHALEKQPESRYQSVDELITDLAFELPLARLSGRLSFESPLAEVLQNTIDDYGSGRYVVELFDPAAQRGGSFVICESHIVSAQIVEPALSGYEALRVLCQSGSCDYKVYELEDGEPEPFSRNVLIKLTKFLEKLPYLPEDQGDLFDQEKLLDQVFSNGVVAAMPKAVLEEIPHHSELPDGAADEADDWHKIAVKFSESAPPITATSASAAAAPVAVDEDDLSLASLTQPKRHESTASKNGRILKKSFVGPIAAVNFFFGRFWRLLVPLFILFLCVRVGMVAVQKFKPADNHDSPAVKEVRHINSLPKRLSAIRPLRVRHAEAPAAPAPSVEPPHRHAYQTAPSSQ